MFKKLRDILVSPKYEVTDISEEFEGETLYRIKALRDFGNVHAGEYGGLISEDAKLSSRGDCWVEKHAKLCKGSSLSGDAIISGHAVVSNSDVSSSAHIEGYYRVYDSTISDEVALLDKVNIESYSRVVRNSTLKGQGKLTNCDLSNAEVSGFVEMYGSEISNSTVSNPEKEKALKVSGSKIADSEVSGTCNITECFIEDHSQVKGDVSLYDCMLYDSSAFDNVSLRWCLLANHATVKGYTWTERRVFDFVDDHYVKNYEDLLRERDAIVRPSDEPQSANDNVANVEPVDASTRLQNKDVYAIVDDPDNQNSRLFWVVLDHGDGVDVNDDKASQLAVSWARTAVKVLVDGQPLIDGVSEEELSLVPSNDRHGNVHPNFVSETFHQVQGGLSLEDYDLQRSINQLSNGQSAEMNL